MNINGIDISISESYYNKSQVGEDGITHTIDTSKRYPMYTLYVHKNYMESDTRIDAVKQMIQDLQSVVNTLQEVVDKEDTKDMREVDRGDL